jgi:hypothetical protein
MNLGKPEGDSAMSVIRSDIAVMINFLFSSSNKIFKNFQANLY